MLEFRDNVPPPEHPVRLAGREIKLLGQGIPVEVQRTIQIMAGWPIHPMPARKE